MPDGIPFMITRAMKQKLQRRGYSDEAISKMTPQTAHDVLNRRPSGGSRSKQNMTPAEIAALGPGAQEQIRRQLAEPADRGDRTPPSSQSATPTASPAQTAPNPLMAVKHEIDTMARGAKDGGTIDQARFLMKLANLATEAQKKGVDAQASVRRYIDELKSNPALVRLVPKLSEIPGATTPSSPPPMGGSRVPNAMRPTSPSAQATSTAPSLSNVTVTPRTNTVPQTNQPTASMQPSLSNVKVTPRSTPQVTAPRAPQVPPPSPAAQPAMAAQPAQAAQPAPVAQAGNPTREDIWRMFYSLAEINYASGAAKAQYRSWLHLSPEEKARQQAKSQKQNPQQQQNPQQAAAA